MNSDATQSRTSELIAFLADVKFDVIPSSVVERAKELVLDHLGVALHSADLPWTRIVRSRVASRGGRPESTVFGSVQKSDRSYAALVNGTAAHGIELDDTHNRSFSHPGAVVISAALAVAEAQGNSGSEFLNAMIVGYEAQGRVGSAARGAVGRGVHPTAAAGVFGAAASCAHLMRMEPPKWESAFGLAASAASGVMQFAEDPQGNMVKRLHGGLPAMNGILMAELAGSGFTGPRGSIDGRFGFMQVFGGGGDPRALTDGLGDEWVVEQISIKLYACCRHFHSIIDALLTCRQQTPFSVEQVESIEVSAPAIALDGRLQYRPQSVMAAQYSLPYAVAATLLLDPRDPRSFSEKAARRQDMTSLMDRISAHADPDLDKYLPDRFPGAVCVRLTDGRNIRYMRPDSLGTTDYPLDRAQMISKFRALTSHIGATDWQDKVIDSVFSLDVAGDLSRLTGLLREAAPALNCR
ncbi:hypothetical protein BZM26_00825 [Paraburkholderia strydomiana]|nr:hypothetical protein BZM26_00825 [Paraburkholderia strydomiana]